MSWHKVHLDDGLGEYSDIWNQLNDELYKNNPFFDARFVNNLLKIFGTGKEYLFVHSTHEGAVDGLVILKKQKVFTWTLFTSSQTQISPVLVGDVKLLDSLFRQIGGLVYQIDFLSQDPFYTCFDSILPSVNSFYQKHALTLSIEISGDFVQYWSQRKKQLRKNLRRYFKKAKKEYDEIDFKVITQTEKMNEAFARYALLESSGWKGKENTAINVNNKQGEFYSRILTDYSVSQAATIYELYFNDVLVASRLAIHNKNILILLKTTYQEEYSAWAPGRLLLYLVLEYEFNLKRVSSIELYTNATKEQLPWATHFRYIKHVSIFKNYLIFFLYTLLRQVRGIIKGNQTNVKEKNCLNEEQLYDDFLYKSFDELPDSVIQIMNDAEKESFDLSYSWFCNLEKNGIDESCQPFILALKNKISGDVEVVLPLLKIRNKNELRSFSTYYTTRFKPILVDEGKCDGLVYLLSKICRKYAVLNIYPILHEKDVFKITVSALKNSGWISFYEFFYGNWYYSVNTNSFDDYYKSLPSILRNTIERKKKKFFFDQRNRIDLIMNGEKIFDAINDFNKVYLESWKTPEPFVDFIPGLITLLANQNELRLCIARFHGQPIGAQIWIVKNRKAFIYKLAYDEKYASFSVGTLLTEHMMRYVIEVDRVSEVDYLIGDEKYKQDWMDSRRELWKIKAYNTHTVLGLVFIVKEKVKSMVKRCVYAK